MTLCVALSNDLEVTDSVAVISFQSAHKQTDKQTELITQPTPGLSPVWVITSTHIGYYLFKI